MSKTGMVCLLLCFCCGAARGQDLYDLRQIREIRITLPRDNWVKSLDSLKKQDKGRLAGTVEIDGVRYDSVGVGFKGNSSYNSTFRTGSEKLPFSLKANEFRKKQTFRGGFRHLKLSNVFSDPSFLREALAYEIAGKYMPASHCNFARVTVNGKYVGLYNNVEAVDDAFLKQHFGEDEGLLVKCDPEWKAVAPKNCPPSERAALVYMGEDSTCYQPFYEIESKHGYDRLIGLIRRLRTDTANIADWLDVDQTLWLHAFNNATVNLDSYLGCLSHNYYLYEDSTRRFVPVIWDLNLCFGGFTQAGPSCFDKLADTDLQELDPLYGNTAKRPLLSRLLSTPLYRKIFAAHLRTIVQENFANGWYLRRARELSRLIDTCVQSDPHKMYSYDQFHQNLDTTAAGTTIIGLKQLIGRRSEFLLGHPLLSGKPPVLGKPLSKVVKNKVTITVKASNCESIRLAYRTARYGRFRETDLFDDGKHGDGKPRDGIYGTILDKSKTLQYYLLAENPEAVAFSPERAAHECHEVKF